MNENEAEFKEMLNCLGMKLEKSANGGYFVHDHAMGRHYPRIDDEENNRVSIERGDNDTYRITLNKEYKGPEDEDCRSVEELTEYMTHNTAADVIGSLDVLLESLILESIEDRLDNTEIRHSIKTPDDFDEALRIESKLKKRATKSANMKELLDELESNFDDIRLITEDEYIDGINLDAIYEAQCKKEA